jgi:hypothetical protein
VAGRQELTADKTYTLRNDPSNADASSEIAAFELAAFCVVMSYTDLFSGLQLQVRKTSFVYRFESFSGILARMSEHDK